MTSKKFLVLPVVTELLVMGMGRPAPAQDIPSDKPLVRHLIMNATHVREARDQSWHLHVTGNLPTSPGLYVIVYNERGDVVHQGAIPAGTYSPEAPFLLEVPKDGLAQQYVIKLLGVNRNFEGITLPMTDLPFEVYEGRDGGTFVMPYPASGEIRRLTFQASPGESNLALTAGNQVLRVLDSHGGLVADNRPADGSGKATNSLLLATQPGRVYWLDPGNANQFGTVKGTAKLYLAFDPERWFAPTTTWDLESRPWWKGLNKR
jgi:hypothetical protein